MLYSGPTALTGFATVPAQDQWQSPAAHSVIHKRCAQTVAMFEGNTDNHNTPIVLCRKVRKSHMMSTQCVLQWRLVSDGYQKQVTSSGTCIGERSGTQASGECI
jgi:hypothetical protein